jgi:hypothetical protein
MLDPAIRQRLTQLLGMGSSSFAGERATALAKADKLVRENGMSWEQVFASPAASREAPLREQIRQMEVKLEIATLACSRLMRENESLKAAAALNGAVWTATGDHQQQAQWALKLDQARTIQLRRFEREFLTSIAGWPGSLTAKQRPVFARIIEGIANDYGMRPPP